jgi:hypothetical protein
MKLKHILSITSLAVCLAIFSVANAQTRHKVVSLVKQQQTNEWYTEQAKLWGNYLKSNPKDADAWLNYYTANRMLKIQSQTKTQDDLDKLVKEMEKAIPNSFEYHYICYWNDGFREAEKNFAHLEKAYELAPNRPETYDDFFSYYLINGQEEKLKILSEKWFASNDISAGIYNWCYNMLMSCDDNAVLITHGDNDTYPTLVLQMAKDIRPDVKVMNLHLLQLDSYRNECFKSAGIAPFTGTMDEAGAYFPYLKDLYQHIFLNSNGRPVYLSLGTNPQITDDFAEQLYNVGLAWKWSPNKFDNIAVIKKNYEKNFRLDYIAGNFYSDISQGVVNHSSSNYLPSMLTLYNHYVESDDSKADELKTLIDIVAQVNNMQDQVNEVLGPNKTSYESKTIDDPREIMEAFVKINDTTYAMKTEVTNEMYERFLTDLLKQKRFDDLAIARNPEVNWRKLLPESIKDLEDSKVFANGHPDGPKAPIVNISHDAAKLYCEWLTDVYNNIEHRKKEFAKVQFRLPSETEWERLAYGGKSERAYAWGGPNLRNAKGCFLGNLDMSEVDKKESALASCESCNEYNLDGAIFPVNAETYIANEFGLYNMTGNVAEMVKEKGISKGGSWNTKGGIATINNKETFILPNAQTGFRVIMIIK